MANTCSYKANTKIISAGNDKPDLRDLSLNVIHQHAAHWESLGALLGLQDYDIANISRDHNRAVDACREMLMMWLRVIPAPTWGKLDDAIRSLIIISAHSPRGILVITLVIVVRILPTLTVSVNM